MTTTLPATLEAVASITGREIDLRTEVRADCPLCGKDSTTSTKLRVSEGEHGGLFAWCYSCNAPSMTILRALGVNASSSGGRPVQREKDKPMPGLMAPEGSEPPPGPIAPVAMRMYMNAIRTPGRAYEVKYYSIDGRVGTHKRTALPPEPGRSKPGKRITMTGLKGHGWYPRKWVPNGGPVIGRPRCITEGEADAGLIAERGLEAYSTPGGAGRYRSLALNNVVNDALADGSPVIIIQDNDWPGYGWGQAVHDALVAQGVRVIRPNPVQLPMGDSLADDPGRLLDLVDTIENQKLTFPAIGENQYSFLGSYIAGNVNFLRKRRVKAEIPRPERPPELRCRAGYGRRGTAAADMPGGGGRQLTMPVDCRKCDPCLEWRRVEQWALWEGAEPTPGQQCLAAFRGMGYKEKCDVLSSQRQRSGCRGGAAFHVTVWRKIEAVDEDSEAEIRYDVLVWYRDGLSANGVKNTRAWAVRKGIECEIEEGLTVTRADLVSDMRERSKRGDDGKRNRLVGHWNWPVKFEGSRPSGYVLGRDAHRVHVPGERGSMEPDGSEAALKRLEDMLRDWERGAAMNARDFMAGISISVAQWLQLEGVVDEGLKPPMLPGYRGPHSLLRDAVLAYQCKKEPRAAYWEVYARIGAPPPPPEPDVRAQLSEIAQGLRQLERRLNASELAGGGVSLIEPPASDEIGVEDYDAWDDFDVAMPEWDDDCEPIE